MGWRAVLPPRPAERCDGHLPNLVGNTVPGNSRAIAGTCTSRPGQLARTARRRLLPGSRIGQSTENVQLRGESFSPARLVKPPSDSLFSSNR